jgi:hypothetical protein
MEGDRQPLSSTLSILHTLLARILLPPLSPSQSILEEAQAAGGMQGLQAGHSPGSAGVHGFESSSQGGAPGGVWMSPKSWAMAAAAVAAAEKAQREAAAASSSPYREAGLGTSPGV